MRRPVSHASIEIDADAEEFERMYRANVRLVYSYTRARVGEDDGADITADVFHAAVVAFRTGHADTVTTPWLMAVTRNKVIDHWRKAQRRKTKAHLLALRQDDIQEHFELASLDREELLRVLDQLSDRHRMLLILHHVDGMSLRELADALETSEPAVRSALARARRAFRKAHPTEVDE